jgi:hypothetical protein
MLNAIEGTNPAVSAAYVGLFTQGSGLSCTGNSTTNVITISTGSLANGNVIIFTALTGGSALSTNTPYYVINYSSQTFNVSLTSGGGTFAIGSTISAGTVALLTEVSGGSPAYARVATSFAAASACQIVDSTSHSINVPSSTTVAVVGYWSASTSGTLIGIVLVTNETFAGQGTYTVTSSTLSLS